MTKVRLIKTKKGKLGKFAEKQDLTTNVIQVCFVDTYRIDKDSLKRIPIKFDDEPTPVLKSEIIEVFKEDIV